MNTNEHACLWLVLIVVVLVLVAFFLGMLVQTHRTLLRVNRIRKDAACRKCELDKAKAKANTMAMRRRIEGRLRQG